jgi:hypothetical protein
MTAEIAAPADALGTPVRLVPLIEGIAFGALIGDKAFDSDELIAELNERGAEVAIAPHPRRTKPLDIGRAMDEWRHPIENFSCKPREFERVALRRDKTDESFAGMIRLAAAVINSR